MNSSDYINTICKNARESSRVIAGLSTIEKNEILECIAGKLIEKSDYIISENSRDMAAADEAGLSSAMKDRLLLDHDRIKGMADSVREIASQEDPVGRVEKIKVRPSGIHVGQMRVPIGVVAVIFESRPNVTTDIAALCIKSGNSSILRGGKEAIFSNTALYSIVTDALKESGQPENIVTLITKTERELVPLLLKMNSYIDIVIPRGGEKLIRMVSEISNIPVIKHDKGLCHTFIDESAEEEMSNMISVNSKVQRPGVCNAMETLLNHEKYPAKESLLKSLLDEGVELRGCNKTMEILPGSIKKANEEDWDTEYLDMILSVKIMSSLGEAIEHISAHSSGHSEAIITADYANSEKFLKDVDSAAVFVNASTRFHDGGEFGLGAEVGISTQKLHARGAMGIEGLTTLKYIVYGKGEIR